MKVQEEEEVTGVKSDFFPLLARANILYVKVKELEEEEVRGEYIRNAKNNLKMNRDYSEPNNE